MKSKKSSINFCENNHILWLPLETRNITLNTAIELYTAIVKDFDIKNNYFRTIEEIKNSKLASEFANLAIKRIKEVKTQKKLLECVLKNYSYEELKNHELFKDYEISEYNSLINKNSKVAIFFEYKPSSNSSNPIAKIINKFIAKENIFRLAIIEKNISLMEKVATDTLKSAPIVLNLLKTIGEWYQKYLNFIAEILLFVKPEFQPDIIKQLANIEDFAILSSFSEILLATKKYDENNNIT